MKKLLAVLLFDFSCSLFVVNAQSYTIHTYAGNGIAGYSAVKVATSAELHYPCAVASDASGNIYIADYDNNRVRKVDAGDSISNFAGNGVYGYLSGTGVADASKISRPTGVATDDSGNVYIADYDNSCIRKVNSNGLISTFAGNDTAGYSGDGGLATAAELNYPIGVAVDGSDNLYIADGLSNCIRKVNTHGIITTIAGNGTLGYSGDGAQATSAELDDPYGVAVDDTGNVYIADDANNRIRKVNTHGIITTIAGNGTAGFSGDGGTATSAELNQPQGVTFDLSGNMYITDYGNQRIRMVNNSGIISTIAGNGTRGFSGDGGVATSAELNNPSGEIAIDRSGNIYIADQSNQRIRKLTLVGAGVNGPSTENGNVKIYPNPNNGDFAISINSEALKDNTSIVEIFNVLGEKVYQSTLNATVNQINLINQAKGIYLYRILKKDGVPASSGKFVIE